MAGSNETPMMGNIKDDSPAAVWQRLKRRLGLAGRTALILTACVVMLLAYLVQLEERDVFDSKAAEGITLSAPRPFAPGPRMPEGLDLMKSNNNVDVAVFQGRFYVAFRTAPTHFASDRTRIVIVSSTDRGQWEREADITLMESDLREPRFLVFREKLFLYFFRGGRNPFEFAPQSIYVVERTALREWTPPKAIYRPGYVVWRARTFNDRAYLSVYHGAGLYTTKDRPGDLRLLVSDDGYEWTPISDAPQVSDVSAEEGEFTFDDEGNLLATVRLEVHGALVCKASHADLAHWECRYTPYKYDSAIMFRHAGAAYVIARRNLAGPFEDEPYWTPTPLHRAWRLARYSLTRKRTCLYKLDAEALRLVPLFDLPGCGDTAYAGMAPLDARRYWIVNYSSDLNGFDWPWIGGQIAGSRLYEMELAFPVDR